VESWGSQVKRKQGIEKAGNKNKKAEYQGGRSTQKKLNRWVFKKRKKKKKKTRKAKRGKKKENQVIRRKKVFTFLGSGLAYGEMASEGW